MHIFHSPQDIHLEGSAVTIGNFDGVHRGHKSLLLQTLAKGNELGVPAVVVTFWPHPRSVIPPIRPHFPLTTPAERFSLLAAMGIPYVLEIPFSLPLAALSPEAFVEQYLLPLRIRHLVTGYDFSLGRNRSGHTKELRDIGEKCHFTVEQMPPLQDDGVTISSTKLRTMITEGDIAHANRLLGRPYALTGKVVRGDGRGHTLGFPTANIEQPVNLLPASGVYVARATFVNEHATQSYAALVNIGHNPTFGAKAALRIESHLLDFSGDCYGETLTLAFYDRLRGEKTFASAEDLISQIKNDCARAGDYFALTR